MQIGIAAGNCEVIATSHYFYAILFSYGNISIKKAYDEILVTAKNLPENQIR